MQYKPKIFNLILLEHEIYISRKGSHGLVIFSRTQIKLTFILMSVYIETLTEHFTL